MRSTNVAETPTATLLCEASWEVCQQLGGIYTVVRSKVPSVVKTYGNHYCLIGPYNPATAQVEFEECALAEPFSSAVADLQNAGFEVHAGRWLVTGKPQVILLATASVRDHLNDIKRRIWEQQRISLIANDPLVDQVVAFGFLVEQFFLALTRQNKTGCRIVAHFHEWMAGTALRDIRNARLPVATVFTTHATLLGRFLAMDDERYYQHLANVDWADRARRYNMEPQVAFERAAAHAAHIFTTVSEITAEECQHLLGRKPEVLVPNGLNIERFVALHEFQNLHRIYKEQLNQLVMGHFFPSYTFDLDTTLYLFTSGRYEYTNKGFDLTIEAMARLNRMLKEHQIPRTIVCFIVTKAAARSINPQVLRARAVMEEIRKNCTAIKEQVGARLFQTVAHGEIPSLSDLVDEYWLLRLRRSIHEWKTQQTPHITTHDLAYENDDAILRKIRSTGLANGPQDPVKFVYHPNFISSSDPLFGLDYDQFVRGCHMGIFPSLYEPWGYAPLECAVMGVPTVTSDLAGFGTYVLRNVPAHQDKGLLVLKRRNRTFHEAANDLATMIFEFAKLERRERISLRNRVESTCEQFDWHNLGKHYTQAQTMALDLASK